MRLAALAIAAFARSGRLHGPPARRARRARRPHSTAGKPFDAAVRAAGRRRRCRPTRRPTTWSRYALLTNADLEQKYWEWRSAIEQIPQDGTQATNLALSANLGVTRGRTGSDRTTLSAGNDPMADIVLPPKLSAAARRALENARAAGLRFRKAQFDLRNKVLARLRTTTP